MTGFEIALLRRSAASNSSVAELIIDVSLAAQRVKESVSLI